MGIRRGVRVIALTISLTLAAAAAAAPLPEDSAAQATLTVYEKTGAIQAHTFDLTDPRIYTDVPGLPGPPSLGCTGYDFGTGGCEYYDLYLSDASGVPLDIEPGAPLTGDIHITMECWDVSCNSGLPVPAPGWVGAGNNIDAVMLEYGGSTSYGISIASAEYGLCEQPFEEKTSGFAESALGPPDADITYMGCGYTEMTILLREGESPVPDSTLYHDPLLAGGDPRFGWSFRRIEWHPSANGYVTGSSLRWNDALVSGASFDPAEEPVAIFRFYHFPDSSNFIMGFTRTSPQVTDFHCDNVDAGVYVHSTGTLRPSWDVSNTLLWASSLPSAGYYDLMVEIDGSAGTVSFAIESVSSFDSPLSDFVSPIWSATESRPLPEHAYLQVNPYNDKSGVFDVWASSSGTVPPPQVDPEPLILAVEDIAPDEGGRLRIRWTASPLDSAGSAEPVTGYAVWRRIDDLPAVPARGCAEGRVMLAYPPGDWDYVSSVPACCERTYSTVIPTLADSTVRGGVHWSVFFVRALTGVPGICYDSPVDSGYSVDDIPPPTPGEFTASPADRGLVLSWEPCAAPDLSHYLLRRDAGEEETDTVVTGATSWTDTEYLHGETAWRYRLCSVDRSGNESAESVLSPSDYGGEEGEKSPEAGLVLHQNTPNPFNPVTAIAYELPRRSRVRLEIYDVSGRLVIRLVDSVQEAGARQAVWNGTSADGRAAGSGVYFCRLTAGTKTVSRKMILLK